MNFFDWAFAREILPRVTRPVGTGQGSPTSGGAPR